MRKEERIAEDVVLNRDKEIGRGGFGIVCKGILR